MLQFNSIMVNKLFVIVREMHVFCILLKIREHGLYESHFCYERLRILTAKLTF